MRKEEREWHDRRARGWGRREEGSTYDRQIVVFGAKAGPGETVAEHALDVGESIGGAGGTDG